jgi:uncharacterized protein
MEDLHISLLAAGFAALIALWLGWRCIAVRISDRIIHGDGGNALMARRMRAQANFTEYTPVGLLVVLVLDLAGQDGWLLAGTALAFLLGRVLHAIGMDGDGENWPRKLGMMLTLFMLVTWAVWASLAALSVV